MTNNKDHLHVLKTSLVREICSMAELLLYIDFLVTEEDTIAYTDGDSIFFGKRFFELAVAEQIFVLIHEVFHIALQHVPRFIEIKNIQGINYSYLWNLATDAIINETILCFAEICNSKHTNPIIKPVKGFVSKDTIFKLVKNSQDPDKNYDSSDELFYLILSFIEKEGNEKCIGNAENLLKDFQDLKEGNGKNPNNSPNNSPGKEELTSFEVKNSSIKGREWSDRIDKMLVGINDNRISALMKGSVPPKINWKKVLRQIFAQTFSSTKVKNWKRPSRRSLAGTISFIEPGLTKNRTIGKIAILFDRSGSCNDADLICMFIAEMNCIQQTYECELIIIQHEVSVVSEISIPFSRQETLIKKISSGELELIGSGGTSFIDALEVASKYKPAVTIAFTDGWGTFPLKNPLKSRLIWATTPDGEKNYPFGDFLPLE